MTSGLRLTSGGRTRGLTPDRTWTIGRDESCDEVIDHGAVSRRHLELRPGPAGWIAVDLGTRNGTWVAGARITEVAIGASTQAWLGGTSGWPITLAVEGAGGFAASPEPAADEAPAPSRLGQLTAVHRIASRETRIGRSPDNDLVIDDLMVSRYHALIRELPSGEDELRDLGSSNGTFVNGRGIDRQVLRDGDVVSIGGYLFQFAQGVLREYSQALGAWLSATDVWVRVPRRSSVKDRTLGRAQSGEVTLLQGVGFAVAPSTLLGIVGPSGAGKTTLLRALTGQQRASSGQVLYGGRDLYEAADLRRRMGYVPQDDLLHPQLTVRQALVYAAELRFAADVDASMRAARVDEVMEELGLTDRADLQIAKLSGGQRKRTSVAAELLTKPSLLFLDEPTSGLDPGNEEQLTALLRQLSDGGRTVIAATHSLVTLERCDRVLFLARGGHVAYYGPPDRAMAYFRKVGLGGDYPKVFGRLAEDGGERVAGDFRRDPLHAQYLAEPLTTANATASVATSVAEDPARGDQGRQFRVLVRRYLAVLRADRTSALILLMQAPFFAFLFALLYPSNVMRASTASEATILIWLMVVGATWMGTSNGIREIVKELPIIRREHGLGVSLGAYLGSKVVVLGAITAFQCVFLALASMATQVLPADDNVPVLEDPRVPGIYMPWSPASIPASGVVIPPQLAELAFDIALVGLASLAIGLLLSSLARNADQANFLLPLVLVAQVVLSAPIVGSPGPVFAAMGSVATAQWGTAVTASTVSLNEVRRPYLYGVEKQRAEAEFKPDPDATVWEGRDTWDHEARAWLIDAVALVIIMLAALGATYRVLRRALGGRDTGRAPV